MAALAIPDHEIGWGPITFHTRYLVDAGIVIAAVGLLFVSFFLISEPDIAALAKKSANALPLLAA